MGTRLAATIACAVLVLTGATCSGDDDDAADDTSTTPTTESPEAEVEAAYLAYREMVGRLLQAPDPEDPEIDERSIGENREFLVDQLSTLDERDQKLEFGPNYAVEVSSVSVSGRTATLKDCTVDDARTVDASTGEVVSEGTTTELLEATLAFSDSQWRVETIDGIGHWEGVAECE